MGPAVYDRAYYHCSHCHTGCFPTDDEFRIEEKQTPGAAEILSLTGTLEPFDEGAGDVLPRLAGLNVSASTVQRTTERVGTDVARRRAAGETFDQPVSWDWHHDAQGKRVAYVGLDATGVRQQGPHAEQAEGRMPYVATVFNPEPTYEEHRRQRVWDSRYVAGLMSLDEIGRQLQAECRQVGIERADIVVALTDGGAGLEDCLIEALRGLHQELVFVLDFWHASEHLQEFAKAWIAEDQQRTAQVKDWCHRLKHEGGRTLRVELESLDLSRASPHVQETHRQLLGYFRNNQHRMDYPQYVQRGWQIGSGKVESACKSVVGERLKGPGMRWREPGTHALCQLRALYKSERRLWKSYWTPQTTP